MTDPALIAVVWTLAIVAGIGLGGRLLWTWRRLRPRRDELGPLSESWRGQHVGDR